MTLPAYTDALERALGQVVREARMDLDRQMAEAHLALANLRADIAQIEGRANDLDALVVATINERMAAIPMPRDGRDGVDGAPGRDGLDGLRGADGAPGQDGRDGAPGERGEQGPAGHLPRLRAWTDTVHYAGDVVTLDGATWQATQDTGQAPPHADWHCLAAAGCDGASFDYRGTWSEAETYTARSVVMLGGSTFAARHDNPGLCPGEGWHLWASRGSRGAPGERGPQGERGFKGEQGAAGPQPIALTIEGETLVLTMDDGHELRADLYPLLAKVAR